MQKKPLVSIIIPYHKKKKYFDFTIKSIKSQTFKNFEIILVYDDINLDELNFVKKKLKKISKKKIIINKKILGPGLSRNEGIKNSKGKYLAFCDADDIWTKNKLEVQLNFMKKNNLKFLHSNYYIIDLNNKKIGKYNINTKISYNDLIQSCNIGLSTVIVDKSLITKKNKFCKLRTKEDYFLWLNIIQDINLIHGINKYLVSWRYTKGSLSDSLLQKLSDAYKLYNYYLKFNVIKSIFYVLRLSFRALIKKIRIYN